MNKRLEQIKARVEKTTPGPWEWYDQEVFTPVDQYAELWNEVHTPGERWEDNPEVWVLEFEGV